MEINLQKVIEIVQGVPSAGRTDRLIRSVVIDSRRAEQGSLFVAFLGEHVDGHDYLADCARRGAVAALVQREVDAPPGLVAIRVGDTQVALQQLAAWYRRQFPQLHVVGITGSSGKTTTKEMVAAVLARKHPLLKTQGNFNNEIGLPLTMFDIRHEQRWAVLELGMAAEGEISQLARICQPNIGVITNIGEAHMLHLGSKEAIMEAKFELAENLVPPAWLIINGDDPWQRRRVEAGLPEVGRIISYGCSERSDFRAENISLDVSGSSFDLLWQGNSTPVRLNLPARHNISNALAAFAVGTLLGIAPEEIAAALGQVQGEKRRLQSFTLGGCTIIDDSYNANPDSTIAALELLSKYPWEQRKVAFVGDMLELGSIAPEKHRLVGSAAVGHGVKLLIAVGQYAKDIQSGAVAAGMDVQAVLTYPDSKAATEAVTLLQPGDVVLIKGSLGVEMDTIVQFVKNGGF